MLPFCLRMIWSALHAGLGTTFFRFNLQNPAEAMIGHLSLVLAAYPQPCRMCAASFDCTNFRLSSQVALTAHAQLQLLLLPDLS